MDGPDDIRRAFEALKERTSSLNAAILRAGARPATSPPCSRTSSSTPARCGIVVTVPGPNAAPVTSGSRL